MTDVTMGVSEALELINQTLDEAYPFIIVEGEVSGFTVNKQRYVFFDIKDSESSLGCFMMVFALKFPIEDGMKVRVVAQPKLTKWGKFSLTVSEVIPVGEGSLKKSFELLKARLDKEGLFDPSRKRPLPQFPKRIGVVSSSQAAGFGDFIKILDSRWGGLEIILVDVQVQGLDAPRQVVGAIEHLNSLSEPLDALAVIRGGGSADDLSSFNHEEVVRAIAASRTPTIVGVGHEVDVSLSDLAADVRAATPSNAAQLLVPDREHLVHTISETLRAIERGCTGVLDDSQQVIEHAREKMQHRLDTTLSGLEEIVKGAKRALRQLDPQAVLRRGYSIVKLGQKIITSSQNVTIGTSVDILLADGQIRAEVTDVHS